MKMRLFPHLSESEESLFVGYGVGAVVSCCLLRTTEFLEEYEGAAPEYGPLSDDELKRMWVVEIEPEIPGFPPMRPGGGSVSRGSHWTLNHEISWQPPKL